MRYDSLLHWRLDINAGVLSASEFDEMLHQQLFASCLHISCLNAVVSRSDPVALLQAGNKGHGP